MNFFDRMLRFQVDEMNSHLQLIFRHFFFLNLKIYVKRLCLSQEKFFFIICPELKCSLRSLKILSLTFNYQLIS